VLSGLAAATNFLDLAGLDMCEYLQHFRYQRTQVLEPVARRNQNDDSTPVRLQILLVPQVLVYRDENIALRLYVAQKHAILQTTVTRLSHCDNFMAGEITPETLWHAFVEIETHVVLQRLCLTVTVDRVLVTRVLYDLLFCHME
jgi:hypothetical protein